MSYEPLIVEEETPINGVSQEKVLELIRVALAKGLVSREEILKAAKVKGRAAPPLPTFTFPGSGITVQIRRLGPFTIEAVSRKTRIETPPPEPPKVEVNYGTTEKPEIRIEENIADPEYKAALADYERLIDDAGGRKIMDLVLNHAVVVDVDLEAVNAMRAFLAALGVPQKELDDASDHEIYVKHVCVQTGEDLSKLQDFVIGQSMPTEERVRQHEESFPGTLPGEAAVPVPGPAVGDAV